MPVIARTRDDGAPSIPDALAIAANASPQRLVRRLATALRIRTLHGTVLRRMRTLASRGEQVPELPTGDPLDEASVLVAGRGRSYPGLSVAVGERVGVVGALSVESAARALNVRDIDGMVIGDGFGPKIVEALLTVLAEDVRFRDLPVAVLGGHPAVVEPFAIELANLERISEGPQRLVERFLPYVRAHAFGQRLKRMLKSLDAKGMIDPDTGLLGHEAFWRDLNRAVDDAEKRGVGLSIARFSFDRRDRRIEPRRRAPRRPLDAPGRFRLPGSRQFDLRGLHRDRSARRACRGAPYRQRAQEHDAGAGPQDWWHRCGGDARDFEADRQRRFAHRTGRRRGCRRITRATFQVRCWTSSQCVAEYALG